MGKEKKGDGKIGVGKGAAMGAAAGSGLAGAIGALVKLAKIASGK